MDLYTPYSMVSFRMILSDPEWLSEIFNDTKHRDSWASCSLRVVFHEKKIFVTPLVWPQRRPHRKSRNLPRKGTPSEFWKCLVAGKLEILRYYMLKKINRLDTIPECDRQTERWTDRQTDRIAISASRISISVLTRDKNRLNRFIAYTINSNISLY